MALENDSVLSFRNGSSSTSSSENKKTHSFEGFSVQTDSYVRVITGPVVGKVTQTDAIVLLEVEGPRQYVNLLCQLYEKENKSEPVTEISRETKSKRPFTFSFSGLKPETEYVVIVNGICKFDVITRTATFKTLPLKITRFRIKIASCDRPSRLLLGQQNPWNHMLRNLKDVDYVLHIGDQIYPDDEDIAHAGKYFHKIFDGLDEIKQRSMMKRGRELWRKKYRKVFSSEGKSEILARVPNLMVWSDNDVANDFTTLKTESGDQFYHRSFLQCGMMAFREYQRRLWDPNCKLKLGEETQEWHCHTFGPVGIFLFDLRGNRIDGNGVQSSESSLLSDEQWSDLETFFSNPDLRAAILCSETPFVGDEPTVAKQKVAGGESLLRDHWPYNEEELIRLCDLCFDWMKSGGEKEKEVLMVGGDIHIGVTSAIYDRESGLTIPHLTTSPITNHVTEFYPPSSGNISERYSFTHKSLGQEYRNYASVDIQIFEQRVTIKAKLVPISTDIFKEGQFDDESDDSDYD